MSNSRVRSQLLETRMAMREGQLELATEIANVAFWSLEPSTGEMQASANFGKLLQCGAGPMRFEALVAAIHPEDQQDVRRAFASALQLRRDFTVEFRVAAGSTAERRLRCVGRPHLSTINPRQPALSGVLQALTEAATVAAPRVGAAVQRVEALREMERATVVNRMKSEVAQTLVEMKLLIEALAQNAAAGALRTELNTLAQSAESGLNAVRSAIFEMRPPGVEELGLAGAIERYAMDHAAAAGIELALSMPESPLPLAASAQEALYAVAQAGIDNVVRHARARNMSVCVTVDANEVALRITDDGVGISQADLAKDSALGLFASSERLAESGGDLHVSGKPQQGTTLEASIALRRQATQPLRRTAASRQVA